MKKAQAKGARNRPGETSSGPLVACSAVTPPDRAIEYIDSPRMTQRLVYRKQLSARIDGNYGAYRTTVRLGRKVEAGCTCPSDYFPCKHVRALQVTWDKNPESFFDLEVFLKALSEKPKAELVAALRQTLLAFPEALALFDVPGFNRDDESADGE